MKYRKIGNSDIECSVVALGTWVFGGDCWGDARDEESVSTVRSAITSGINLIDTAPIYGGGRSEKVIGKALRGLGRDSFLIATKCGLQQKGKAIRPNLTASFIREEIENSLKRLGVETIDIYQCHWPDPNTPFEETFSELNSLAKEGKIRYIGVSNFSVEELKKAAGISNIVSNQLQYSLFERSIEKEMLSFCHDNEISVLSYGSLGGGILSGKYAEPPQLSKGDVRSFFYRFYKEPYWSKSKKMVSVLEEIAKQHGMPVSNAAINWVLSCEDVASCIVGCRNAEQLKKNISAGDENLSMADLDLIESRYREVFGPGLDAK